MASRRTNHTQLNAYPSPSAWAQRTGRSIPIRGFAHITGGGFVDNLPRILPNTCEARIRLGSWEIPPLFSLLQQKGRIATPEMYQVFRRT